MGKNKIYDVIIIGAGPAGAACYLALQNTNLHVALLERERIPRDKVCGDSIGSSVIHLFKEISPELENRFKQILKMSRIEGCQIFSAQSGDDLYENINITEIKNHNKYIEVIDSKRSNHFHTSLLIGCDGANSIVAKKAFNSKIDHRFHSVAVRAYYKNISNVQPNMMEVYLIKNYLPCYFWIFPMNENLYNVGFGILSVYAKKKIKMRLKKVCEKILTLPSFKERMRNAVQISPLKGHGIPLASRRSSISGYRLLLAGDAANLVDTMTGEGITNAMLSGILAAKQACLCFEKQCFDPDFMKQYDKQVNHIKRGQKIKYGLMRNVCINATLLDFIVSIAGRNSKVNNFLREVI